LRLGKKKVILVFGLSRSGTTMLGKFLALESSVYLHEPEENILLKKFRLERSKTFDYRMFTMFVFEKELKAFKIHCLMCTILQAVFSTHRTHETMCVKPIYLIDVMEEAASALRGVNIMYISRHPCGRSESILRQRQHDQNIDPASTSESYFEMLGRAWGESIHSAQTLFNHHPEWFWVLFEDLTKNPVPEFEKLYGQLGLPWNETVQNKIHELTTGEDGGFYEIKRNSVVQAEKWRNALTENQIQAIRRGCAPFNTNLYESF
jgi:hypothetical protein